jgi:hypothetical protein
MGPKIKKRKEKSINTLWVVIMEFQNASTPLKGTINYPLHALFDLGKISPENWSRQEPHGNGL